MTILNYQKIIKAISVKGSDELIKTHKDTFSSYDDSLNYSEILTALVMDFQKEQKLKADGIIGKKYIV